MNDDRPPICPRCGVTMVPADLSAQDSPDPQNSPDRDWICLECEETAEPEET
jgi:transposase